MVIVIILIAVIIDSFLSDSIFGSPKHHQSRHQLGQGRFKKMLHVFHRIHLPIAHPIQALGFLINTLDRFVYGIHYTPFTLAMRGGIVAIIVVAFAAVVGITIDKLLYHIPYLWPITTLTLGVFLASGPLVARVTDVMISLENQDIKQARTWLGHLVSRETQALDEPAIVRGAIESLAENAADGFVSPLLFFVLGSMIDMGCTALLIYKAVNTLDSMLGYRTQRYRYFGMISARSDDVLSYCGSRLTAYAFLLASVFLPSSHQRSRCQCVNDGWLCAVDANRCYQSPNAGWPIGAFAGVLDIRLGGKRNYAEGHTEDQWVGKGNANLRFHDIQRALKLYRIAHGVVVVTMVAVTLIAMIAKETLIAIKL